MHNFCEYFLYYTIYAFFGYICEVVYVAICTKKITNRGYLYGPMVPIYGYGAIGVILSLSWAKDIISWGSPFIVFALGFILTTVLEYLVSLGMELIFHMRWWDYSDKFLNINGRVCLRNSTMFGLLVVIVIYGLHPFVVTWFVDILSNLGNGFFYSIVLVIFILQVIDTIFSTIKHINVAKIIRTAQILLAQASLEIQAAKDKAKTGIQNVKDKSSEKLNQLKEYLANTRVARTIFKAEEKYPTFKIKDTKEGFRVKLSSLVEKIKDKIMKED